MSKKRWREYDRFTRLTLTQTAIEFLLKVDQLMKNGMTMTTHSPADVLSRIQIKPFVKGSP